MTTTLTAPHTSSAVAKAARVVDIAAHADDAGATIHAITCGNVVYDFTLPDRPLIVDCVGIQTDGRGFLALVDHFGLTVVTRGGGNIDGYGEVGICDFPVHVFANLVETLAAGLVTA